MRTALVQHVSISAFRRVCSRSGCRYASTWQSVSTLPSDASLDHLRDHTFGTGRPIKFAVGLIPTDARGTWLKLDPNLSSASQPPTLNYEYLSRHSQTLLVPIEFVWSDSNGQISRFERTEAAPLELFLNLSASDENSSGTELPRAYIAQASLSDLPSDLGSAGPFPTPDFVLRAGRGDIYASSLWLGRPPTSTPLHRDPNPNLFVQVAGQKTIRLLQPDVGSEVFREARRRAMQGTGGSALIASEKFRGEEMMAGAERTILESTIWNVDNGDGRKGVDAAGFGGERYEAVLDEGEALFIPVGWWHAVRSVGTGNINLSVNWWFR